MKRRVLLAVIALLMVVAILFIMMGIHTKESGQNIRTCDSYVPLESDIIINENVRSVVSLSEFLGGVLNKKSEILLGECVDTLAKRGLIKSPLAERFALNDSSGAFVALYRFNGETGANKMQKGLAPYFQKVVKYDNFDIYTNIDTTCFAVEDSGWFILSNSLSYLKSSLMIQDRRDSVGFCKEGRLFAEDANLNVVLTEPFTESEIYMDLYADSDAGELLGQGFIENSAKGATIELTTQISDVGDLDRYFPTTTIAAEWLVLSDLYGFYSDLSSKVKRDTQEIQFGTLLKLCDTLFTGEVAQIICTDGKYILLETADPWSVKNYIEAIYGSLDKINLSLSSSSLLGDYFSSGIMSCMGIKDNLLVLADSKDALERFKLMKSSLLEAQPWYKKYKDQAPTRFSYSRIVYADNYFTLYGDSNKVSGKLLRRYKGMSMPFGAIGMQWESIGDKIFLSVVVSGERSIVKPVVKKIESVKVESKETASTPEAKNRENKQKTRSFISGTVVGPVKVINHNTKAVEWILQDNKNRLYLFDDGGKKLWEAPIEDRIISEIVQVDRYKNGKLQYLFSTKSKIYLVDRNGVMVSGYPLKLTTQCNQGITLCDYDKNRNYRIFVPRSDKRIELFDIEGKKVSGWQSPILKSAPVTRVKHFRVGGKDYIVVADKSKLYIFDRKGNVRVNCNKVFNLSGATVLTLEKYRGQNVISVKDGAKKAIYINFIGKEVQ